MTRDADSELLEATRRHPSSQDRMVKTATGDLITNPTTLDEPLGENNVH